MCSSTLEQPLLVHYKGFDKIKKAKSEKPKTYVGV